MALKILHGDDWAYVRIFIFVNPYLFENLICNEVKSEIRLAGSVRHLGFSKLRL